MSVKGLENVTGKLKLHFDHTKNEATERAITEMLMIGGANAIGLTPSDTGNLVNSQGKKTEQGEKGWEGAVFYGAYYAKWVHNMPGKLKGQPRAHFGKTSNVYKHGGPQQVTEFGGGTGVGTYWSPDAEPHFLKKGMDEMAKDSAEGILTKHYGLNK